MTEYARSCAQAILDTNKPSKKRKVHYATVEKETRCYSDTALKMRIREQEDLEKALELSRQVQFSS